MPGQYLPHPHPSVEEPDFLATVDVDPDSPT
jgi:hypothetical protein